MSVAEEVYFDVLGKEKGGHCPPLFVSVIVPLFNQEKYIAEAIKLVLEQTYIYWELIIIDDCSADNSWAVARRAIEGTNKAQLVRNSHNIGVSATRNKGVSLARGNLIAFLDADDVWHRTKLSEHVYHFLVRPQLGLSFSYSRLIDENSALVGTSVQKPKQITDITPAQILCRNPIGNGSSPVINAEIIKAYPFDYRLTNGEDIDCWLRIALFSNHLVEGIPLYLTYYRVHSNSASHSLTTHAEGFERMLDRVQSYSPTLYNKCGNLASSYVYRFLARRAFRSRSSTALSWIWKALKLDIRILWQEPIRTATTFFATLVLFILNKLHSFSKAY